MCCSMAPCGVWRRTTMCQCCNACGNWENGINNSDSRPQHGLPPAAFARNITALLPLPHYLSFCLPRHVSFGQARPVCVSLPAMLNCRSFLLCFALLSFALLFSACFYFYFFLLIFFFFFFFHLPCPIFYFIFVRAY